MELAHGDFGPHLNVCSRSGGRSQKRAIFGTSLPLNQSFSETVLANFF